MYPPRQQDSSIDSIRSSFYPTLGQPSPQQNHRPPLRPQPPPAPQLSNGSQQNPLLRVQIAEPYRTLPPVLLRPGLDQVPRVQASFEFDLERRVLSEHAANPSGTSAVAAPQAVDDPFQLVLERYMQMGYEREEVAMGLAAHDGQEEQGQVVEFCRQYRQLRSMGFAPATVAGSLIKHRDDLEAATEACLSAMA